MPETVDDLVEAAAQLAAPDRYDHDSQRIYFGLEAGVRRFTKFSRTKSLDAYQHRAGLVALADRFIDERGAGRNNALPKGFFKAFRERYTNRQADSEHALRRVLSYARSVEYETAEERLQQLVAQHDLTPWFQRQILLPTLEYHTEEIRHQMEMLGEVFSGTESEEEALAHWFDEVDSQVEDERREIRKGGLLGTYIRELTERHLHAKEAHEKLLFFAENGYDVDLARAERVRLINMTRQEGTAIPEQEYAIRLQIKLDPSIGEWLDDEYNQTMLEAQRICAEHGTPHSTKLYSGKQLVEVPSTYTTH